jgi:electron transfer flavoprotein beta subunit
MNVIILLKMVADVVEELVVADDGRALDSTALRMILSEPSDHALEQALLLKEKYGAKVTVATLEAAEVDDALFTALAKGADQAIKIPVEQTATGTMATAALFASFLSSGAGALPPDTLILTGSQAIDDLEGELGPSLAEMLHLPFLGVVTGLRMDLAGKKILALKEFSGGLRGEYELPLPAVIGIQAAEKPPRYVPVAKVRSVMKSAKIETRDLAAPAALPLAAMDRMYKPEAAGRAQMLEGAPEEIAQRFVAILAERGLI